MYGPKNVCENSISKLSPAGTAESFPGWRRGLFSAVPSGPSRPFKSNPGLASWAKFSKFSRPCGTEFENEVLTHALQPYLPAVLFVFFAILVIGQSWGLPEFYPVALGIVEPRETAVVVILALGVYVDGRCSEFCQHGVQVVHP